MILSVELMSIGHFRLMLGIMSGRSVDYPSVYFIELSRI